ncbi:MAG: hypothetical protein ACHQ53_08800 [Polyangiales bacterium]
MSRVRSASGLGLMLAMALAGCLADTSGRDPTSTVGQPTGTASEDGGTPKGSGGTASGGGGSTPVSSGGSSGMTGMGGGPAAGSGGSPGQPDGGMPIATGGFDAGTDPNRNAVMPGGICERVSTIQCAGEAACCTNPGRTFDACKSAQLGSCMSDLMADQIAGQAPAGFDATQAKAVFTQLETLTANCDPSVVAFSLAPNGFRSIFKGTVAPGGNCKPANVTDKAMAGGALASCTMSDGYACMPTLINWNCNAHAASGGKCFTDINCKDGLFCDNPNLDISGSTCMTRKVTGAGCVNQNECQSLFCKKSVCVAADKEVAYCLQ